MAYWDSISALPSYYVPTITQNGNKTEGDEKSDKDVFAEERAKIDADAKKAQEEFLKRMELLSIKKQHDAEIQNLKEQQEAAEKACNNFKKTTNSKGCARVDSGQSGIMRWLANAGTALTNIGKSLIGIDKDGNFNPLQLAFNVGITALSIGLMSTGVGAPVGYTLLALGIGGGAIGMIKGAKDLDEAEKSGDQTKIDEAQQDICSNAFIALTSIFGMKGMGASFRTSSTTAELASAAAERSGLAGKAAQSISNFGRDVTVNAFRSAKYSMTNKLTQPSLLKNLKGWDKQYVAKSKDMLNTLNQKIAAIDKKLAVETDAFI